MNLPQQHSVRVEFSRYMCAKGGRAECSSQLSQSLGSEECYNDKNHRSLLSCEFDIISDFLLSDKSETRIEKRHECDLV